MMRRQAGWIVALVGLSAALGPFAGCSIVNSFDDVKPQNPRGVIVVGGTIAGVGASDQYVLTALDPSNGSELAQARRAMTVAAVKYDGARDLWYVFESGVVGHFFPLPTDPFYLHVMRLDAVSGAWTELGATSIPAGLSFSTTTVLTSSVAYVAYRDGSSKQFDLVIVDTSNPSAIPPPAKLPLSSAPVALIGAPGETDRVLLCATSSGAGATASDAGASDGAAGAQDGEASDAESAEGAPPSDAEAGVAEAGDTEAGNIEAGDSEAGDDAGIGTTDDGAVDAGADARAGDAAGAEAGAQPAAQGTFATLTEYFVSGGFATVAHETVVTSEMVGPLVGFAAVQRLGTEVPVAMVVSRPLGAKMAATLSLYDPVTLSVIGQATFPFADPNVQPPAFSTCDSFAFVVGTNVETNIYAVDIGTLLAGTGDGGVLAVQAPFQATGNSGQGLYFEPYTNTVLAPFSQGDKFKLWAFAVQRAPDGAPQLVERQGWSAGNLRPNFIATKIPSPFPTSICGAR